MTNYRVLWRLLTSLLLGVGLAGSTPAAEEPWLWVYAPCNFQVDKEADRIVELMRRARKARYNGIVLTDSKFGRLTDRPKNYYDNLRRVAKTADEVGIEIIPIAGSFGYSNDLLQNDPNLAEGLAVRDCLFAVHNGRATVADDRNLLPFGNFEDFHGNTPAGWDYVDGPGQSAFADTEVKHGGRQALRFQDFKRGNEGGNARVIKKLTVKPRHQYHISVWLRTRDLSPAGEVHVTVLGADGRSLNWANLDVKPTEDWTQHHAVFNTLDNEQLTVLVGIWGGQGGTLWIDDVDMRLTAGINLLRRTGCPLRVTSEDGTTEYVEGKDFRRWEDPKMGQVPWPGGYEVYHEAPPLVLTEGSRIRDGQQLKVSFYHTQTIYEGAVACCLTHDDVFRYYEDTVKRLNDYFHPKKFFVSHDELRLANQCELCRRQDLTAGQLLAGSARRSFKIIHQVAPQAEVLDWSDMFDPYHNAVDQYYLVHGTLAGSWEGLDRDVVVVNWNSGKASESLRFFADRGQRQLIAGYYDTDNVRAEVQHWATAAKGVRGVRGYLYTTWRNEYRDLEKYAEEVRRQTAAGE